MITPSPFARSVRRPPDPRPLVHRPRRHLTRPLSSRGRNPAAADIILDEKNKKDETKPISDNLFTINGLRLVSTPLFYFDPSASGQAPTDQSPPKRRPLTEVGSTLKANRFSGARPRPATKPWPAHRAPRPSGRENGGWKPVPTTVPELIASRAEIAPGSVAIGAPQRTPLTYLGLKQQVESTVKTLTACGVGRGDRVAIVLPNGPELAVAFVSAAAGAALRAPESLLWQRGIQVLFKRPAREGVAGVEGQRLAGGSGSRGPGYRRPRSLNPAAGSRPGFSRSAANQRRERLTGDFHRPRTSP